MDRLEILDHLRTLGQHLERRGLQGDLYVVGGAVMALAYDARRTTRDVDAVFEPKTTIYEVAALVAQERGLPPEWLNDAVKGLLAGPDPYRTEIFELPGVRVEAASAQMLLALKVLAHRRDVDADDLRLLARHLDLRRPADVLDLAERLLAPQRLTLESALFVEEALDDADRPRPD